MSLALFVYTLLVSSHDIPFCKVDGMLILHCPLLPPLVPCKAPNIQYRNIREVVDDHAHRPVIARLKL